MKTLAQAIAEAGLLAPGARLASPTFDLHGPVPPPAMPAMSRQEALDALGLSPAPDPRP